MRAMYELALNYNNGPTSIKTISDSQEISNKYLHSLFTILKANGLVRSVWGSNGGFLLSRPPAKINLYEIVKALEGPISLVDCVADESMCDKGADCITRGIWTKVSKSIEEELCSVSLNDLIKQKKSKAASKKRPAKKTK